MVNQDITNVPNKKFGGYDLECRKKTLIFKKGPYNYQNALYTRKHFYLPKGLRKHMQGGVCMPCGLLLYLCWIIKMYMFCAE